MKWVSIGTIADLYSVSTQTIRNWEKEGMFRIKMTRGGHRRFLLEEEQPKKTVIYARVSSHDQKEDLKRQTHRLNEYCRANGVEEVEVIEEIGSGMNYRKKGLKKLIDQVIKGEVGRIVVSFKDRLMRFGNEIFTQLCALKQVELVEINKQPQKNFQEQLVEDILMIMTVFTSRIYGKRSHQNRKPTANDT